MWQCSEWASYKILLSHLIHIEGNWRLAAWLAFLEGFQVLGVEL